MKMVKIGIDAHEIEKRPTGVGRVLLSILNQWNDSAPSADKLNGIEFILYFKEEIPDLNLSEKFKKRLLNSRSNALFVHYHLPKAAREDEIDLLFCPGYVAPLFYKKNIALTLHDIIYQARPELYSWPGIIDRIFLKKVSQIAARKAKVILTCSEFSRNEIIKHYFAEGEPASGGQSASEKVKNIPLAADRSFRPIEDRDKLEEVKEKYGIKDKFILYLGSIFDRRHLPETIRAFERIEGYQFLIVGRNYSSFDIEKITDGRIIRRDYLEEGDLPLIYNAADLFIYLSDYEGFGLPVLEAMSCGTPVVTSRAASIPEVAGEAAIYVEDNKDINEIEKAIAKGLTDQGLRQSLVSKGLEQSKKFSWEKTAQETLDALLSVR